MATDGPDPPACDEVVFNKGKCVMMVASVSSNRLEGWVKKVAKESKQQVDWHFMGGRAVIKALGDIAAVKAAIANNMPELEKLYDECTESLKPLYSSANHPRSIVVY